MQEFIQQAMQQFGRPEDETKNATGSLLEFISRNGQGSEVSELLDRLPGARALMASTADGGSPGGGGMLGGLAGQAGSALGLGGGTAGLLGTLQQSGLGAENVQPFLSLFMGFVKEKVGADLAQNALSAVPGLSKLLG